MDKAEIVARLQRLLAVELDARERCGQLKRMGALVDSDELDRHVAACNRNAVALTVAIELVKCTLSNNSDTAAGRG